ncbi:alkylation response protein AidB-like acyl-CoA dehydrogenase [Actinoplanes octamycinicus]|uniref:Alkylation response protein AidB-like acyl-CoA dehydrogenase n=1 Tax=Actinoplanes octamycinicus TaxID=135948 RepID=A0A7W7GXR4_9ACTN|nr:acyl-CoA dehydrogenase [Actinoplanes octamycinicus]MBB4740261.1 alkylation response protein AidB-like acyl-CoA dehydrogenase [Actinoplanes octamycinicus]GIE63474.1 acyl-CoA dehydrogenase [Actinoplanes octamycinicus]
MLFNPNTSDFDQFDPETRRLLRATVDFFEERGKKALIERYINRSWYDDFLAFSAKEGLFATFLTPSSDGSGAKRWDTARNAALSEILGFYGLDYWYVWQVTVLGLGPVWQSANQAARAQAAELLDDGHVMAFGLSERSHGADIYSTDMVLTPTDSGYVANGTKYYIGNGNVAGLVSVFGKTTDGYVFFKADSRHPAYHLIKNVVNKQMYVSTFELRDYPVREEDVLHTGQAAFDAALNTVNIGKFNLCTAAIGICEHAMYEAVTHAHRRILYGKPVTDFPHVRRELADAYVRLVAMKLFSDRAVDYFRSAGPDDRRYLLFNPMTKMKVTTEGERVIDLMWDVIAAKGFEADTYFDKAAMDIRGLPKLEGTVHVNLALILKFMPNYLHHPAAFDEVPTRTDASDDEFLFRQGPARGLGAIRFHDWRIAYDRFADLPNVAEFRQQADALCELDVAKEQHADLDFLLSVGQLFALVVYGQLILEQAELTGLDRHLLDEIFAVLVRDFSAHATDLHGKTATTAEQAAWALANVRRPVADEARTAAVWEQVLSLVGAYEMRP